MLKDVRAWILLFALIRLVGITNPPLEVGHAWRQSITNMIARNFIEVEFDLFHPRIDHGGDGTGIIGCEFPLLNGLIALLWRAFGPAHWYGRLIVLIVSSIGMWCFSRLVKEVFDERTAFVSTLILLASVWFEFSRKIMPDTFSVSLVFIGLYHAVHYLRDGRWFRLLWTIAFVAAGGLSKMPALCLCAAMMIVVYNSTAPVRRKVMLAACAIPVLIAVCAWYFAWVPHLVETYGNPLFFTRDIPRGLRELWASAGLTAEMFYFHAFRSFAGFAAFVVGLVILFRQQRRAVILGFLSIAAAFAFFMVKAGDVFSTHGYYMISFAPVMAVVAALALDRLRMKWSIVALGLICVEGVANQYYDMFIPDKRKFVMGIEAVADRFTERKDLVIVNSWQDPQPMYFLHRKGWSIADDVCDDRRMLDSLGERGAKCLFKIGKQLGNPLALRELFRDDHLVVMAIGTRAFVPDSADPKPVALP